MKNILMPESGFGRNNLYHHRAVDFADVSPGVALIWRKTRRPLATCRLLAEIAGLGHEEAR